MTRNFMFRFVAIVTILSMLLGAVGAPQQKALAAPSTNALQFTGANTSYVTFGQATSTLGASQFTLELWFKRTGAGATASTGTGGVTAIPLLTKGLGEADGSNVDCNYFLGIRGSDNVLVADFEDSNNGLNHPIAGVTALPADSTWHHAAATYNGTKWQLFLDGMLEAELNVGKTPRSDSIQHAGLATAMTSTGARTGGFAGVLDEARIWNYARTQAEILSTMNVEIASPDPAKLLGYWKVNEGSGNLLDVSGHGVTGTVFSGTWVGANGFPINVDTTAPATVAGLAAASGDKLNTLTWTANADSDLRGYNVYRSTSEPVPTITPINGSNLVSMNRYVDGGLTNGTSYYYVVTAVDSTGNASTAPLAVSASPVAAAGYALQFNGSNQYVTFGRAPRLGVETFTIEGWFKRTGAGATVDTGGVIAEPLITKGRGEADNSNVDMNYFIGIRPADGFLVADFEDGANGANHPIIGTSSVADGTWHHVALTYDVAAPANLRLYLDGTQQAVVTITKLQPRSDSIQHTALGTALNSTGVASGYFNGLIDEVRIWDYARSQTEINTNKTLEILAAPGLLGRWGLNEGTGTQINDTSGRGINGIATNSPPWVTDTPFSAPPAPPAAPTALNATSPNYYLVNLTWTDNSNNETGFEVNRSTNGAGGPFSLLTTTAAGVVSYNDTNVQPTTEYCYRVRAVNSVGQSDYTSVSCATTPAEAATGLSFDGTNDYVTFGVASGLGVTNFTLEAWFYWTGGGTTMTTSSTQGLPSVYPLISKGRGEADSSNVDMNYFLGIDSATHALAVDFEDMATGMNYPFVGTTPVSINTWHHAVATYDSVTGVYNLYLDGNLAGTSDIGNNILPRSDSIQHAGIASAMTSIGSPAGYFQGYIDEARIWNYARTGAEIKGTINQQVTSGTGLVARWGMGEGSGTTINSSVGTFPGTLTNGPVFVAGAPFNITFDTTPPSAPTGLTANGANMMASLDWADNTDSDLAGYNVYRRTNSVGFAKVNTNLVTASAYTDSDLLNGTEYYYVVRAVDTSGNESTDSNEAYAIPTSALGSALEFTSTDTYVTFGDPAKLDLATFTIETWFKRTGAGTSSTTGTNGISNAIPLVTHGAPQDEGSSVDANWVLVIDDTSDVIAADFEDMATGLNHPVYGTTPISLGTWHHAAATWDGSSWKLYLDGKLEATLAVSALPRSDTTQQAALGTMLETDGTPNGYFQGVLDEARVWNRALSQTEILANINDQVTSGAGLVARWGMNEGAGGTVVDSIATTANGTFVGSNFAWVPGAPFDLAITPNQPTLVAPADLATGVGLFPTLSVHVSDALNSAQTVSFYGRPKVGVPGADFTIIAIPDPQYYASTYPTIYNAQMNWVVANKITSNIKYVLSLGDNVNTSTNPNEFTNATTAWDILTTGGVPYGLTVGNHDGAPSATANFNTAFGTRLSSQLTYGGRYGTSDYDNTYATFSASGMDFIVFFFEYDASMTSASDVLVWANGILAANPSRRAIVVTHDLLNGNNFSSQGAAIFNALKGNSNLFLMLGGHLDTTGRRQEEGTNGNIVYALRSDYQGVDGNQSGYLRIMRFSPSNNLIHISTYSPNQNKSYPTSDTNNTFDLPYTMDGVADFSLIGSTTVPSGSDASVTWSGLQNNTDYEWYAVSDNGGAVVASPTWSFTTETISNQPPVITEGSSALVTMSEDGSPIAFDLTLHATDPDAGDTLTWSISSPASNGAASASGTSTSQVISFAPNANYNGSDSFIVQVSDGNGGIDTITVNVTIQPVNDAPVCSDVILTTPEDTTGQVAPSCTDVDGDPLTYSIVAQGTHGTASVVAGSLNYAPAADFNGSDSFTYKANDTHVDSNTATVNVTVASSLVGYWPMEEGSGTTIIDASSLGNNGSLTGDPLWVSGMVGNYALSLNGSTQYATVPDNASLDLVNQITIAAWIKPGKSGTQDLIKKSLLMPTQSAGTDGYELSLSSATKVFFRFNQATSGDNYRVNSTIPYPTIGTTWMHVAATYDGAIMRLYINGVQEASLATTVAIATNTLPLTIGTQTSNPRYYQGSVDDVRVYNRALTLAEIQVLAGAAPCYALTLSHTGEGSDPVASPANSTGCPAGQYVAGANIGLSGAVPTSGWQISGWTGTTNDSSTGSTNTVTMPASAHVTGVNYTLIPPVCYALTLSHTGQGSDPVAFPANSDGCNEGQYIAGASISLSGAVPTSSWQISSWTGTNADSSTADTNTVTMPAGIHTASVNYSQLQYTISGNAGVAGTTITYTGGSTTANGSGDYAFSVLSGWSGTAAPSLVGYTFAPASLTYTNVMADQAGQNYVATPVTLPPTGLTCTTLNPKPSIAEYDGTGHKAMSRVWQYENAWWAVFSTTASGASSTGTWLWKLEGTTWVEVQKLATNGSLKADVKALGDRAYILLFNGSGPTSAQLATVQFSGGTYQAPVISDVFSSLSGPGEQATLDIDSSGRMWVAMSNAANGVKVFYSDLPYSTWSGPVVLESANVWDDDTTALMAMPGINQVGVLWGNQYNRVFKFFVHTDGTDPTAWTTEIPPYNPDWQNVGTGSPTYGVADDHINLKVASDGTLYAAVKTSYDTAGYPKMALYVRRPAGTWEDLYGLDESGTRPIVLLDEIHGLLTYIYTSSESYNPIVYRQSSTENISFTSRATLRSGSFNDVTSLKANYNNEFVVLYFSSGEVAGQKCTPTPVSGADLAVTKSDGRSTVRPNEAIVYTIAVANNGPLAVTGATVADTLPAALIKASWTCIASGGASCTATGTGSINDTVNLPVGSTVTYSLSASVDLGARGVVNNTATVTLPNGITDPVPGNNIATDVDTIVSDGVTCESDPTLVGCWPMEEGSGTVLMDGSSYLNDAALVGAPAWDAGKVGSFALDLNGTSQYGAVADDASLDLTAGLTLAAWIKPEAFTANPQDVIKKAAIDVTNGYELSLSSTGSTWPHKVFFRINQVASGDTYRINSNTLYPTDGTTWMHVAATYDGATMKLYINGVLESSMPATVPIVTNDLPLTIGAQDGATASRWYQGWIDEARVYNRALTGSEIQALFGNRPPVAADDNYSVAEDAVLTVAAPGVLGNDADADLNAITVIQVSSPAHGALILNADGSFSYTPAADYSGSDSFTYKANDGMADSNVATATITVTPVNDAPVLDAIGSKIVDELVELAFTATASDADPSDTLTFNLSGEPAGAVISPAGAFTWTLTEAQGPDAYSFEVCVSDGVLSDCETIAVTVNEVNLAPVAVPQTLATNEDTPLAVTLVGTDSDLPANPVSYLVVDGPSHGTLNGTAPNLTYTPAANYNGPDSFTFKVNDGTVDSNVATVSITVTPVNDAPVVVQPVDQTSPEGATVSLQILASDVDSTVLSYSASGLPAELGIDPATGLISGSLDYTSAGPYNVTVTVSDGDLEASKSFTWTVTNTDRAPVVTQPADQVSAEGSTVSLQIMASDPDNDMLTYSAIGLPGGLSIDLATGLISGSLGYSAAGSYNVMVSASAGELQDSKSFTWNVNNTDRAPVVTQPADQENSEGAAVSLQVVASDPDNDELSYSATGLPSGLSINSESGLISGTLGYEAAGIYQVTVTASDGELADSQSFTWKVNNTNRAPVAVGNAYVTEEDTLLNVSAPGVLGNDTDPDGDALTVIKVSDPVYGTLTFTANGSFDYAPAANWNGTDSFTYKANDGTADSDITTVTITVNAVNDAPVAVNDAYSTADNQAMVVTAPGVLGNDSDVDQTALSAMLVTGPAHGTLTLNADGSFTYTPSTDYTGSDSFSYKANDGSLDSNTIVVSITVLADLIFADGFESGSLGAWSSSVGGSGDLSVNAAAKLVGSNGLELRIDDNNNPVYLVDNAPAAEAHYRARFYFDPNSIGMVNGNAHTIFYGYRPNGVGLFQVTLYYNNGYQVRVGVVDDAGTTWKYNSYTLLSDGPHYLELEWQAATGPGANNGIMNFWVDGVLKGNLTNLDTDTCRVESVRLGAITGIDSTTRGSYFIDAFESHRLSYIGMAGVTAAFSASPTSGLAPLVVSFTSLSEPVSKIESYLWDFGDGSPASTEANPTHPYAANGEYTVSLTVTGDGDQKTATKVRYIHVLDPDLIFRDGFESGSLSAWSSSVGGSGDLSVSAAAKLVGSNGLELRIDDNNNPVYLVDNAPAAEAHYRARFYFDPNSIGMANGNAHTIFYGYRPNGVGLFQVTLYYNNGYQVRVGVVDDAGTTWKYNTYTLLSDGPHYLELEWQAATGPGANNGIMNFWVDGVLKGNLTNLDTDTCRVESVRLGAITGIDSTTRGSYFIDAFESHRLSYIGP